MEAANRVVKNTGFLYARMAITVFISLYTTRVVLGALGAQDFGIFNLVGGTVTMLTFLHVSMTAATQRFMSYAQGQGDEDRQHRIFNVSIVLHAGIALLVLGLIEGIGYWLFDGILKIEPDRMHVAWMVYQFAAASTFCTILTVPYDAIINAREHMHLVAILGVIEALLKLAIALAVADASSDKLELYGLLMALLSIALSVIRVIYCHHKYYECELALRNYFSRPLFKEMTAFAGWSFLSSSTSMVTNYGQGIVLNMFFGTAINAAQGVASQVSGQVSALAGNMMRALNPHIDKSEGAGNREQMLKASMLGTKVGFFLLMLFYIPILLEMPYIFGLWLTNVPKYAVIFCILLLIRTLIRQLSLTLDASILAVGKIKGFRITNSFLTILPLPVTWLLFRVGFAPYALYWISIAYVMAVSVSVLYFANKLCGLPIWIYLRDVVFRCVVAFIITLIVSASPLLFLQQGLVRLSMVMLISVITFFVAVMSIGFCKNERLAVIAFVRLALTRISNRVQLT